MPIYLDIETSKADPEPWMIPDVSTMEPPGTHKKPDTIAKWREEKTASIVDEIRDRSSLEPLLGGFVVAIGIAVNDQEVKVLLPLSLDEIGERQILRTLESGLARYPDESIVAYSGAGFDFPFLRQRAIRHGLYGLSRRMWQSKPWWTGLIDPFLLWQGSRKDVRGKLRDVARFLNIESTDTTTGKDVQAMVDAEDLEAIRSHCAEDVRLLREVFACMAAAGWVDGVDSDDYAPRAPAPPRPSTRAQIREAMIDLGPALIQDAASAAGVPWRIGSEVGEAGPVLEGASPASLRGFLAELLSRRQAA